MLISILVFIAILGLLIFVHEFGHFIVAKLIGVQVEEFAFGFPPRVIKWKKGETLYSINLIPLGGYVRLAGEFGEEMLGWKQNSKLKTQNEKFLEENHKTFFAKSVPARLAVIVAGVVMNWVTAVLLITIGFSVGMAPIVSDPDTLGGIAEPIIIAADVQANSAAERAGIDIGDQLIAGDDEIFSNILSLQTFTRAHRGEMVKLTVKQLENGQTVTKTVSLADSDTAPLGVSLFETAIVQLPVHTALVAGVRESYLVTTQTLAVLGHTVAQLFQGRVSEEIGGPVLIYSATAQAIKFGFGAVMALAAVLSVNLALINIMPFPALDGGRALFIVLEGIFRKPIIRQRYEQIIHTVGFAVLILLILAITYRDIVRIR